MNQEELNELSNKMIGIAIDVHKKLGPGFVEKIYGKAVAYELKQNNVKFVKEKIIRVKYKNLELGEQRVDFLIENELILELKAVNSINDIHMAQMLSYLKTVNLKLGLILNFATRRLEIKRVVNNF